MTRKQQHQLSGSFFQSFIPSFLYCCIHCTITGVAVTVVVVAVVAAAVVVDVDVDASSEEKIQCEETSKSAFLLAINKHKSGEASKQRNNQTDEREKADRERFCKQ
mmetsp:Transcript_6733/g.10207  ORF Transcript_6733/g.10207 Transcript_6733/m.10207 type:complete len:106 (-) Transcript_6733:75-392(-)